MSIKKKIRDIIAEHSAELAKGTIGYFRANRKIWLTDGDYAGVYIWGDKIEIGLHLEFSDVCVFFVSGYDLDSVWRKFRYAFKKYIAKEEEYGNDKAFLGKLKELYSLL